MALKNNLLIRRRNINIIKSISSLHERHFEHKYKRTARNKDSDQLCKIV